MPLERSSDVDDVKRSAFIACSSVQHVAMSASLNAALDIRPRPWGAGAVCYAAGTVGDSLQSIVMPSWSM